MPKPVFSLCVLCVVPLLMGGCPFDTNHNHYDVELVDFNIPRTIDGGGEYLSSEIFGVERSIRYTGKSPVTLRGFALKDQFTCDYNGVRMMTSGPTDYGDGYVVNPGGYAYLGNAMYSHSGDGGSDVFNQPGVYHFVFRSLVGTATLDVVVLASANN